LLTPLARADDARGEQALELAVTLVNVLVEQGLLSRDKARDLMQQAQDRVAARAQAGDDAAVVAVAAGYRVARGGNDQRQMHA
jgi:hypothetical protein